MSEMERILITGWPRTGKTTMSHALALEARGGHESGCAASHPGSWDNRCTCPASLPIGHTDDLIGKLDWSAASAEVAKWLEEPGPFIIEGVAVARALRKYREAHPDAPPPCERLIYLRTPHVELTARQAGMGKGVDSVMAELQPWLMEHGLEVERL